MVPDINKYYLVEKYLDRDNVHLIKLNYYMLQQGNFIF